MLALCIAARPLGECPCWYPQLMGCPHTDASSPIVLVTTTPHHCAMTCAALYLGGGRARLGVSRAPHPHHHKVLSTGAFGCSFGTVQLIKFICVSSLFTPIVARTTGAVRALRRAAGCTAAPFSTKGKVRPAPHTATFFTCLTLITPYTPLLPPPDVRVSSRTVGWLHLDFGQIRAVMTMITTSYSTQPSL